LGGSCRLCSPPNLDGNVAIQQNSRGLWFVSGQGTAVRKTYAKIIYVPSTSQFYNKVSKHEEKHELQVSSGIASQLWLVSNFMNQISAFTDSTEAGLRTKINNAALAWDSTQLAAWNAMRTQAEQEAYAVSDPLNPQYAFQNCGRY
jgi:glycerol kinase